MDKKDDLYESVFDKCRDVFRNKYEDYGSSWRVLRLTSITDQIFIKIQRIRTIQEKAEQYVNDPICDDVIGIVNYSIIALMQIHFNKEGVKKIDLSLDEVMTSYDSIFGEIYDLYLKKNHDYGEAWKLMRTESIVDMILTKIMRLRKIEQNNWNVTVSENIDSVYSDIVNYGMFLYLKWNNLVKTDDYN